MRDDVVVQKRANHTRLIIAIAIILVLVLLAVAVVVVNRPGERQPTPSPSSPIATASSSASPSSGDASPVPSSTGATLAGFDAVPPALVSKAKADLPTLVIKPVTSMTGYSRAQFGAAWTDSCTTTGCGNHCDTRNDILARDLTVTVVKSDGCTILSGILNDPYTGKIIMFVRGVATSTAVQIDHLVPLGDAWTTGAQNLSMAMRTNLGNDPLNLAAADGPANESKGDKDASAWLPPQAASHCAYVVHQVEVKVTYHLWVTRAEYNAMATVLADC